MFVSVALVIGVGGVALLAIAADQFVLGAARVALIRQVSPLAWWAMWTGRRIGRTEGVGLIVIDAAIVPMLA